MMIFGNDQQIGGRKIDMEDRSRTEAQDCTGQSIEIFNYNDIRSHISNTTSNNDHFSVKKSEEKKMAEKYKEDFVSFAD